MGRISIADRFGGSALDGNDLTTGGCICVCANISRNGREPRRQARLDGLKDSRLE